MRRHDPMSEVRTVTNLLLVIILLITCHVTLLIDKEQSIYDRSQVFMGLGQQCDLLKF